MPYGLCKIVTLCVIVHPLAQSFVLYWFEKFIQTSSAILYFAFQTRILVTHGISFLPYVDEIVVLVDGVLSEVGSYSSLRASKGAFSEFLDTYAQEESNNSEFQKGKLFPDML